MPNLSLKKLLGDGLVRASSGEPVETDAVCGQPGAVVGLYFSALWCPPCASFTVDLDAFYRNFKNGPKLEIVFVSSDQDEQKYRQFVSEMPWLAIPFSDRERATNISRRFRVQGIPTLILVDSETGQVITNNAREMVIDDPHGREFPWRPRTAMEVLADGPFEGPHGESIDGASFNGFVKGIYFSANWCPPCKAFTPQLVKVYEKLREAGHRFEVVFVSSDRSPDSFEQYRATMPWLSIPYCDEKRRKELTLLFGVQGIPTLVILDEDGNLITKDGRFEINEDIEGEKFPWRPQLVAELTEKYAGKLNEDPCLILFTEADDKEIAFYSKVLQQVAEENAQNTLGEHSSTSLSFFVGGEAEICDSLREFAELEDSVPLLSIFDIPDGKQYILDDDVEITTNVVRTFVQKFYSGQLIGQPFRT